MTSVTGNTVISATVSTSMRKKGKEASATSVCSLPVMRSVQGSLDDLGTPLSETTFVVVDLETTGGSPATCGITAIRGGQVPGGEVIGEPGSPVGCGLPVPP